MKEENNIDVKPNSSESQNKNKNVKKEKFNKGFFKKLTEHFDKHSWFYAEIVGILGQTALKLLGGN